MRMRIISPVVAGSVRLRNLVLTGINHIGRPAGQLRDRGGPGRRPRLNSNPAVHAQPFFALEQAARGIGGGIEAPARGAGPAAVRHLLLPDPDMRLVSGVEAGVAVRVSGG